jgi:hypothetical protein
VGAAQAGQQLGVGARPLGDFRGGVARRAADLALGREEDQQPAPVRPAQLVVGEALFDEPREQVLPLGARLVVQSLEEPLRGEVHGAQPTLRT